MLSQESLDSRGNLFTMRFQGEMSRIKQMRFNPRQIPFIWNRAFRRKDKVILSPDNQGWGLIFAEKFLKLGIEGNIGAVVVQHVQLNVGIARPIHSGLIQRPGGGIEMAYV